MMDILNELADASPENRTLILQRIAEFNRDFPKEKA